MGTLGTLAVSIIGDSRDLDKTFDKVDKRAKTSSQNMQKFGDGMFKAGLAITGVGVAATALGKQVEPLNQSLDRTAALTGESSQELRELALSLTDASFPLEDVTRGMEHLVEKGIDTKEGMEAILPVLDAFSDATGKDIVESIDLFDTVLSALNIPLEEAGDHIDTMTYIVERTNIPLGTLQRNLARVPEELQALGFGLDESTAAIQFFTDQGYSGQEAVREFRRAVAESEGDMGMFLEVTGMTATELENYQKQIAGAAGITDDLAEINNRSITVWDNLKQRYQEIIFEHGEVIESAGHMGQIMMGVGPIVAGVGKGISALGKSLLAQGAATKIFTGIKLAAAGALKVFGIALKIALGPIGLIILAVAALAYGVYLLIKNWDKVSEFFVGLWETVKDAFAAAWEWLKGLFVAYSPAVIIYTHWDEIMAYFAGIWDTVKGVFSSAWDAIVDFITSAWNSIQGVWSGVVGFFSGIVEGVRKVFARVYEFITAPFRRARDAITDIGGSIRDGLQAINPFARSSPSLVEQVQKGAQEIERAYADISLPAFEKPQISRETITRHDVSGRVEVRLSGEGTQHLSEDAIAESVTAKITDMINSGNRRMPARTKLSMI